MVSPSGMAALISPPAWVGLDVVLAWCKGGAGGKVTRGRPHTLLDPPTGERCLRRGRRSRIGVAACRPIGCPARAARAAGGYYPCWVAARAARWPGSTSMENGPRRQAVRPSRGGPMNARVTSESQSFRLVERMEEAKISHGQELRADLSNVRVLCDAPVLRTRVMRQPRVLVGRAVAMAPGEVEHGGWRPRRACDSGGSGRSPRGAEGRYSKARSVAFGLGRREWSPAARC